MSGTRSAGPKAPAIDPALLDASLILAVHGIRGGPAVQWTTRHALEALGAPRCVTVGLFLDRGEHGEEDIPELLAPPGERAVYTGPVGIDPMVPDLILEQLSLLGRRTAAA